MWGAEKTYAEKTLRSYTTKYLKFNIHSSTIIPLMRQELWATVETEFNQSQSTSLAIKIVYAAEENRGHYKRSVFHCQRKIISTAARDLTMYFSN